MSQNGGVQLPNNNDETEIMSQEDGAVYTGESCSQLDPSFIVSPSDGVLNRADKQDGEGSFDPDATFVDVNLLKAKPQSSDTSKDKAEDCGSSSVAMEQSNLSNGCSQELTQPVTQTQESTQSVTQDGDLSPLVKPVDKSTSDNGSVDETFELINSQDIQNTLSPVDDGQDGKDSPSYSRISTLDLKISEGVAHSLPTVSSAISSSSSSSLPVSSSASSKRATESDDTDDNVIGSQDMFESQNKVMSVSQFVPTLQLSGDLTSSQDYERFLPSRLCPSTPTSGLTSTPLRPSPWLSNSNGGDVASVFDEQEAQKLSEKRKLSDSSDETKPDTKRSKTVSDSRQSVVLVEEVGVFKKPHLDSLDNTAGSQAIVLHYSHTESEGSPLTGNEVEDEARITSACAAEHDISVVNLDDVEDEIQFVSPQATKSTIGEITLDSSGHDVEVLSPLKKVTDKQNLNASITHDSSVECSPFQEQREYENKSTLVKPWLTNSGIHVSGKSKENIEPDMPVNLLDFEKDFVLTFTCTYRVSCKTSVDVLRKKTVARSIPTFEVLNSNTVVRRDSSPSAVEESSPGRGGGSPGSVASGPGPFTLQPSHAARLSMFSTTSSSSAGSAASIFHHGRRGRAPAQVSFSTSRESPKKLEGLVPWRELLNHTQDELAASASPLIEKWEAANSHSSSSDDSKIIGEDKVLDPVPEVDDPEEVLGIPVAKAIPNFQLTKRLELPNTSATTVPVDLQPSDVAVKGECETPPPSKRKRGRVAGVSSPRTPRGSSKKKAPAPTSRKKNPDVPPVAENSSRPDDSVSSGSSYFIPGSQVFAHWMLGEYYPGQLGTSTGPNQWNVVFHDGKKKELGVNEIHFISTFEIGHSVCAINKEQHYEKGKVVNVIPEAKGKEELYKVKLAYGNTVTVPLSQICLTEKQINELTGEQPSSMNSNSNTSSSPPKRASASKISSIDLDNILPGKRVRTPKASQAVNSPGRPGPSNTARRLITDNYGSSTADDEPLATDLVTLPNITGVQPEQVGFEKTADPLARKGKGVKKGALKKPLPDIDDEKLVLELGPIPPDGSRIFAGFSFLLTVTDAPRHRHDPVTDSERNNTDLEDHSDEDGGQCASDFECHEFTKARMVKDRLKRQIIQGGGKVLKHWSEIVPKDIKKTYAISNRPSATAIFIQCLVRHVKCVNHEFIIECCRENKTFASGFQRYFLPMGFSYKKSDWKSWEANLPKSPLQGKDILIEGEKSFRDFWEEVLKLSGATVHTIRSIKGDFTRLSVILSEKFCSESTLKHARDKRIPVVSPMWVIQSLVESKPPPHDEMRCFAFDYVDCD